jgi:hypothetical protein
MMHRIEEATQVNTLQYQYRSTASTSAVALLLSVAESDRVCSLLQHSGTDCGRQGRLPHNPGHLLALWWEKILIVIASMPAL